jgi:hypothetical protein
MEEYKMWGATFFKNVTSAGGSQSHAIKTAPRQSIIIASHTQKMGRMWGYTNPPHVLKMLEKNRGLYEIITEYPHKVYFDIDEETKVDNFEEYIQNVKQTILQYFPEADMGISGSHTDSKTSLHICVNNYFIHNDEHRKSMKVLCKELKWDWKVYTNNRLMKCINQSKPDGRVQTIIELDDFKKHLITCWLGTSLPFPTLPDEIQDKVMTSSNFDLSLLPKMVLTTDVEYNDLTPEIILSLLPLNPTFEYSYTHQVARYCFNNKIPLEKFIAWVKNKWSDEPFIKKWQDKWQQLANFPPITDTKIKQILSYFYPHLFKDVHYKNFSKTFDIGTTTPIESITPSCFDIDNKFLVFNTGMGSGKTAQTASYLKKQFNSLWIAPNKALAKNTEYRLKEEKIDIQHYLNFSSKDKNQGILDTCDHLICVLNSTHYVKRNYDVVVIDEVETVFDKFLGDFMEKKRDIWQNFLRIIRSAKRVILLDAFITTKTIKFISMIENTTPCVYVRKFEPQTRTVHYMKNFEVMLCDIQAKLRDGKKLFIFYPYKNSNSNYPSMEQIVKVLQLEGKQGIHYNADVDDTVKTGLMNINQTWQKYDFVITNNVITCGVNYEMLDFDYKYVFIASFNTPRDIAQVTYRCRHLNTGIIKVCYLKGQMPDAFLKDTDVVQCPIYNQLYSSITTEKMCPLRRSFQLFCTKANYKQDTNNDDFSDALKSAVIQQLADNDIQIPFHTITLLDDMTAEQLKQKTFDQQATMSEKIQLTKYYYVQSIDEPHRNDDMVHHTWNDNSLSFLKQIGKMLLDDNSVFHKIAKLNGWTFLPDKVDEGTVARITLKKVIFNDEILDQIFKEFKFRSITRTSQPKKILQSVYNLYFKKFLICSKYGEDKNVSYTINGNANSKATVEWAKEALILNHEVGTFVKTIHEGIFSDEVDEFFEL